MTVADVQDIVVALASRLLCSSGKAEQKAGLVLQHACEQLADIQEQTQQEPEHETVIGQTTKRE